MRRPRVPLSSCSEAATAAALLAFVLALLLAPPAGAVIIPAATVDGPSSEIVGFGGVAMAEDGTGGVVYLKRSNGVPHVFVSRFMGGRWLAPMRVDTEEPFAGAWPRIGAVDGGELIVTWATPYALNANQESVYEMLGSVLGAGGEQFGRAIIVDRDIEAATGTAPELAVSSTGQADLAYRVVRPGATGVVALRPADVAESVKVAHFDGLRWTGLGAVNRDSSIAMRPPSATNGPRIAIGPTGNGIVVWQEPELNGVARIWARRIFGTSLDYVMPASATTYAGASINDDADAPAVAFSQLGQAEVVYRQPAGGASPLPGPRIFWNVLPDGESANGGEFQGARVIDEQVAGGKAATVGPPSIDIDERQSLRVLYDADGAPRDVEGTDRGLTGALTLGSPFAGPETAAESVMNPEGGGLSAWPSIDGAGHPAVAVREDFPTGAVQTGLVSGGNGGEVSELAVGRSGLGDGIVAFRQGPLGNSAIVAASVSAPPALVPFVITLPKGWVRPAQALVKWLVAPSADGPVRYGVVVDGHLRLIPEGVFEARIDARGLSSGRHSVQVLATDRYGQATLSAPAELMLADSPPKVRIARNRAGNAVSVRFRDPWDGLDTAALSVSFGDGSAMHGRANYSHRYSRAGAFRVTVSVRDKLGNAGVVRRWVSVR